MGSSCEGNRRCDGLGNCVDCVEDAHCEGGDVCAPDNVCVPPHCVNGVTDADETDVDCGGGCPGCEVGQACVDGGDCESSVCEEGECQAPRCGDGVVHDGEGCDDGNDAIGDDCPSGPDGSCAPASCGDGFVHAVLEECDDGNASDADDCLTGCLLAACGDGFVKSEGTALEECDDGNSSDNDACVLGCRLATCGDGYVFSDGGPELCDDGNLDTHDDCPDGPTGSCLPASCEDGFVHDGGSGEETDVDCGGSVCLACPAELLLSEFAVAPAGTEFIEIANRGDATVNLAHVYLADYPNYYGITQALSAPSAGDFRLRFPAGASIGPKERIVIALASATNFASAHGSQPDYDLDPSDPGAPSMDGEYAVQSELKDAGEMLVLFTWDGESDLVRDLDYVVFGASGLGMDKSGVVVGASTYSSEVPLLAQQVVPVPAPGESAGRCNPDEGNELESGSNGYFGDDETSEDLAATWEVWDAVSPGARNRCAGGYLWGYTIGRMADLMEYGSGDRGRLAVDQSGAILFTGNLGNANVFGTGAYSAGLLAKIAPDGTHLWSMSPETANYSSVRLYGVDAGPLDSVAVVGFHYNPIRIAGGPWLPAPTWGGLIAKLDGQGGHVWSRSVGNVWAGDVAFDAAGDLFVVGQGLSTVNFGGSGADLSEEIVIAKLSGVDGSHIWSRAVDDPTAFYDAYPNEVHVDAAGDVVITGGTLATTLNFGGPGDEIAWTCTAPWPCGRAQYIVKLSGQDGQHTWSRFLSEQAADARPATQRVDLDASGDVYTAGRFWGTMVLDATAVSSAGSWDGFLSKFSGADGSHLWTITNTGGSEHDDFMSVAASPDGTVVVAGMYVSADFTLGSPPLAFPLPPVNDANGFVAKFAASSGALLWGRPASVTGYLNGGLHLRALAALPSGQIALAGTFEIYSPCLDVINFGFDGDALSCSPNPGNYSTNHELFLVSLQP